MSTTKRVGERGERLGVNTNIASKIRMKVNEFGRPFVMCICAICLEAIAAFCATQIL